MWTSFVASIREKIPLCGASEGGTGSRRQRFAVCRSGNFGEALEIRCLPAVLPRITVSDVVVTEADTNSVQANLVVSLDRTSNEVVSFRLQTRNRTAIAGVDYNAVNAVFTIPAGSSSITIPIEIRGDLRDELTESFDVSDCPIDRSCDSPGQRTSPGNISQRC
jgi:hypothetical protein